MSGHSNRTKSSSIAPGRRRYLFTRVRPGIAAHIDNEGGGLYQKKKKEHPGMGNYESNSTELSAACRKGNHSACTAKKCKCVCRHY